MSKEWLEEIRKLLVNLYNAVDVDEEMKHYIFNDLKIEWLIEQAEKAEKYREALKFYVNGNHYSDKLYDDKIILLDDGEIARKALEGTE